MSRPKAVKVFSLTEEGKQLVVAIIEIIEKLESPSSPAPATDDGKPTT